MIHFCRFLCIFIFWILNIPFVAHNTTHRSYTNITTFICGWCQAIRSKLRCKMRDFPEFRNIPYFWPVMYIPITALDATKQQKCFDTTLGYWVYSYKCICLRVFIGIRKRIRLCICTCICICIHLIYIYAYICVCICIRVYLRARTCVYVCIAYIA